MPASILPILFCLDEHPLADLLSTKLHCSRGELNQRHFPDGEYYLRITSDVKNKPCIVLADLSNPNNKYLPLMFLAETLREFGAASVGLLAPYLSYMRQDKRFHEGEALTSKIFAQDLSQHMDWLVTVDPHLHRYHSLDEIYTIPSQVIQSAPALSNWLQQQGNAFLVGPDAESEQWVKEIAEHSGHDYVIGKKQRFGDRHVEVQLPNLGQYQQSTAIIIDDVISSGHTILECIEALKKQGIKSMACAAVHGVFADNSDKQLLDAGLKQLVTCNTIKHSSNAVDVSPLLVEPIQTCIAIVGGHAQ